MPIPSPLDYVAVLSKIAQTPDRVLLLGDLGSGQAVAAFTVHRGSARKDEAFEVLRCTGLTDEQFASELCGSVGRAGDIVRSGALAKSDGGTLCLIGVDDLSQQSQAMLVRTLKESSYFPKGASQQESFDARIVSAPTNDLRAKIQSGQFRMDLYHLLSEQIINIPSLNDRRSELSGIVSDQLKEIGAANRSLSKEAMELLKCHKFTGGFRELRNILKRAVSWYNEAVIDEQMLSFVISDGKDESAARIVMTNDFRREHLVTSSTDNSQTSEDKPQALAQRSKPVNVLKYKSLKEQERQYWEELMQQVHGNKQRAAKIAGISLRTLYRRMESAGL